MSRMEKILRLSCCAGVFLFSQQGLASEKCASHEREFDHEQVIFSLKKQGYKLRSLQHECAVLTVQAWDKEGKRVSMRVNPQNGEVLRMQHEEEASWLKSWEVFEKFDKD